MGMGTCAVVICHGLSEYKFVQTIKSKLRLNIEIFARSKGKSSIQMDKLPDIFSNNIFKNVKSLTKEYETIEFNKKQLYDCKIFTIMDLDDCKDQSKINNYIHGNISGIGDHELKPYIIPIYFKNNFEDALTDIDFKFVASTNREKHQYVKVFGPDSGVVANEDAIIDLNNKFLRSDKTNIDEFLSYCLKHQMKL